MTHDAQRDPAAYERLRAELLTSGLTDWISLAEVEQIVSHFQLADTDTQRQDLVFKTIGSLLKDGLVQIGELPGPEETFPAWEPIDVALNRLHERFIGQYDEPASWDYSIWLGLTDAGQKVARELRAKDAGSKGSPA